MQVLPTDLNRLLIIVVVLSMALTPFLAEAGKRFGEMAAKDEESSDGALIFKSDNLSVDNCVSGKQASPAHTLWRVL